MCVCVHTTIRPSLTHYSLNIHPHSTPHPPTLNPITPSSTQVGYSCRPPHHALSKRTHTYSCTFPTSTTKRHAHPLAHPLSLSARVDRAAPSATVQPLCVALRVPCPAPLALTRAERLVATPSCPAVIRCAHTSNTAKPVLPLLKLVQSLYKSLFPPLCSMRLRPVRVTPSIAVCLFHLPPCPFVLHTHLIWSSFLLDIPNPL